MIKQVSTMTMMVAAVLLFAAACATTPVGTSSADIANPGVSIAELQRDDYEVLGTVTGSASVTENSGTGSISGDTEQYGYIGYMPRQGQVQTSQNTFLGIPVGPSQVNLPTPEGGSAISRANAAYAMIMEARDLGADAIIFVSTTEEVSSDGNEATYNVEMSGRAIRIREN